MKHTFVVDMKPKSKERPRLGRRRKAYTPQTTLDAEYTVKKAYVESNGPQFQGPVYVVAHFYKDHVVITIGDAPNESKLRGDIDNYLKLILDALQPEAFPDDRQVVTLLARKAA